MQQRMRVNAVGKSRPQMRYEGGTALSQLKGSLCGRKPTPTRGMMQDTHTQLESQLVSHLTLFASPPRKS